MTSVVGVKIRDNVLHKGCPFRLSLLNQDVNDLSCETFGHGSKIVNRVAIALDTVRDVAKPKAAILDDGAAVNHSDGDANNATDGADFRMVGFNEWIRTATMLVGSGAGRGWAED